MGYSFTYWIFKVLGGCKVGCYVHYPTISTDMLEVVETGKEAFNNNQICAQNPHVRKMKLIYYKCFAWLYSFFGSYSDVILVNSSWTRNHISKIWHCEPIKVYPPCNTKEFSELRAMPDNKIKSIVSLSQFRPEKNHQLQLSSFKRLLSMLPEHLKECVKLKLIGGVRNEGDKERVRVLEELCSELEIEKYIEFHHNIPFKEVLNHVENATIGLHTMWNEHFGIGKYS